MKAGIPDFYIIGAPKCGTTALYRYLSEDSRVFMPFIKEPHFFGSDLKGIARVSDEAAYRALFKDAPPGVVAGEASATYLFSKVAVASILAHRSDAKFIIMLRRPLDAVRSYHLQVLKGLLEDIEDFDEAWAAQPDRAAGRRLPPGCQDGALLQYGATFRYADQVRRVLEQTPESQRLFLIYEEFFADPAAQFAKVQEFLGLEPGGRTTFKVFNAAAVLKNRALAKFYLAPPPWARALWAPFRSALHRRGVSIPEILGQLNTRPATRPVLTAERQAELAQYFDDDLAELEMLLDRSLDIWRRGSAQPLGAAS